MSAQLTYPQSPAIGFQGMIAQNFAVKQIDSGLVETAALGLGYAVVNGTADNQYVKAAADEAVAGVVVHVSGREQAADGSVTFAVGEAVPVMKKGRFFGVANGAIAKGTTVAFDPATNKFGPVVGTTTTLAVGGAHTSSAADGDLIVIEIHKTV